MNKKLTDAECVDLYERLNGFMTWSSNATRADMVNALRELLVRLEASVSS